MGRSDSQSEKHPDLVMIPQAHIVCGAPERDNVEKCLDSSWISSGKWVKRAEQQLCRITGRRYAVCTSSGTSALLASMIALDLVGVKVAIPAATFVAVENCCKLLNCSCHYFDSDYDTFQPVVDGGYPPWEGMIVAGCYGGIPDMDDAMESPRAIIEDAAESFGGSFKETLCGAFGKVSILSFYANKLVTCGEGGACLTDDEYVAKDLRKIVNHGMDNEYRSILPLAFNGRMTDLQASFLCAQLERIEEFKKARRELWMQLLELTSECGLKFMFSDVRRVPSWWAFPCLFEDGSAYRVRKQLAEEGVDSRRFFPTSPKAHAPTADRLHATGLVLPVWPMVSDFKRFYLDTLRKVLTDVKAT